AFPPTSSTVPAITPPARSPATLGIIGASNSQSLKNPQLPFLMFSPIAKAPPLRLPAHFLKSKDFKI
ncbi:hypothetical protein RZS08_18105, partial [Arthrospira platensis SPKY1]|nr:hypothetical protein [Arthrospira platensis SPKY1]